MARNALGAGTIRKKTIVKNGKSYTYWEGRYTTGYDPGTGKQIQKSISGKNQREVAQKLRKVTSEIDTGTYQEPSKLTVGQWLDIWASDYLVGVKPYTVASYQTHIRVHIKPALGAVKLTNLTPHAIQGFYNSLGKERDGKPGLSPKTIKDTHGVFHKALQQAVKLGYIRTNPTDACELPRVIKKELRPLDEEETKTFIQAIKGHRFETLYLVTLFTGLREGEVIGLQWSCVDFDRGVIRINKQLQREKKRNPGYVFAPLKNDKTRQITPAPWVMQQLKAHQAKQNELRQLAGPAWEDGDFVFTNELGHHLTEYSIYRAFKTVVTAIGRPDARFHDLRHSYAVAAIRSGDDIKTIQGNLGHATASFTLDVYGHVTDQMKRASAERMNGYIENILNL